MHSRSLMVAPQYIQQVRAALPRKGFPNQQALAEESGCCRDTVRKFLNGRPIDRMNFIELCGRLELHWLDIAARPLRTNQDPNFVGREKDIATLDKLSQRSRAILIQSAGGVGKTTLARKYLAARFENVIEFVIGRETGDIAQVEGLLEQCLCFMEEEPGRDFWVSLTRLSQKLQARPMGVLIDNLEPALDEAGRFIKSHRRYLELLRVLTEPTLKSFTLITSREPLGEGLDISFYRLPSLTLEAWQTYFNPDADHLAISSLYSVYQGNALAMKLLCERVYLDYREDIALFWQEHQNLGMLLNMENLIKEQFDRLEKIYPHAYHLLCRMGCYRYKDVPAVPLEGLFCLLWDVTENQRRRIVTDLLDRSLVESVNGGYQLHSLIREEAITRLRMSDDWKKANCQAAKFWTESVKNVITFENALQALEGYYHYFEIGSYEEAAKIIAYERDNNWERYEPLGNSLYRLGFAYKFYFIFEEIIDKIVPSYCKAMIVKIQANILRSRGNINQAIQEHKNSIDIIKIIQKNNENDTDPDLLSKLEILKLTCLIDRGLCYLDIWELKKAEQTFMDTIEMIDNITNANLEIGSGLDSQKTRLKIARSIIKTACYIYLSFIASFYDDKKTALFYLEKVDIQSTITYKFNHWGKSYSLLFFGITQKNLGNFSEYYQSMYQLIDLINTIKYPQIQGKILSAIGEFYRSQEDYEQAIDYHLKSIKILEDIGAKSELSEAYYQFGLTCKKMGNDTNSSEWFKKSINLWSEINAPKQIEKVNNAPNSVF